MMTTKSVAPQFTRERKDASQFTKNAHQAMYKELDFSQRDSFIDAAAGFIGTWEEGERREVWSEDRTRIVWTLEPYRDQVPEADTSPETVNPSLWRKARLNTINGLFRVTDGFYQVRAFDMSNMTIIEGKDGIIIIDPMISCECAADGLALYRRLTGSKRQVTGVIFTHSHVDHYGGVLGVITPEDIKNGVAVVAPDGFMEHAVSENIHAGIAMSRRAQYMFGPYLKAGTEANNKGQVDTGLGKGQSIGRISIAAPTITVTRTGERVTVDGVEIVFHMTPGGEAPSGFDFYFPKARAFCAGENAVPTMHNIQTLRGARVRDSLLWSKYLNDAANIFGEQTDVLFASHHWPIWDSQKVIRYLKDQRDMYRYLNDQTLRMLNKGYTGVEIAEVFQMPPGLAKEWWCRGYYGTVSHNVKGVYNRYMGWYDGNPSNLHSLPPAQSAPRYVEAMGGAAHLLERAYAAHQAGEYRWAAELLHHLVFADEKNESAKLLLADVLEQLGYQAEAATWRNVYLMGAQELRDAPPKAEAISSDPAMTAAMTVEMIFDAIAANLNGPLANADATPLVMNWIFTDIHEDYLLELRNGALNTTAGKTSLSADVTVMLTRRTLDQIMSQELTLEGALEARQIKVCGDTSRLAGLFSLLDPGVVDFPIVTPRPDPTQAWRGSARLDPAEALKREVRLLGELPRGC